MNEPIGDETVAAPEKQKPEATAGTQVKPPMDLALRRKMYGENSGTSGYKVLQAKPQLIMPPQMQVQAWINNCNNPESKITDLIEQGKQLLMTDIKDYNSLMHVFGYQGAEWTIHLGQILVTLKTLIRKSGQIWVCGLQ